MATAAVAAPTSPALPAPSDRLPAAAAAGPVAAAQASAGAVIDLGPIAKPETDPREYRAFQLASNGLRVVVVHDAAADKAAAALDVNVGHFSDPEELPGLSHFLEHMLFLGTAKYPDENSYNAYLNVNGGHGNASTSMENTCYYFDLVAADERLREALDRFAQFFAAPLFTASATERELSAVDAENKKNLTSDDWRYFQLNKSLSNASHPFHKFGSGNRGTLHDSPAAAGIDVRAALLAHHREFYSASIMNLVVVGAEPLDTLQRWVLESFAAVPSSGRVQPAPYTAAGNPWAGQLPRLHRVVPIRDVRSLRMVFPMPPQRPLWRQKPMRYLSHLLGHEGTGSLLSLLKRRGWANSLSAGSSIGTSSFELFKIAVELTELGLRHTDDIVALVFLHIERVLRQPGAQRWVWDEMALMSELDFRFREVAAPAALAQSMAGSMKHFPVQDLLRASSMLSDFDAAQIEGLFQYLTPDNMRLFVISKAFDGKDAAAADAVPPELLRTEQWYQTPHTDEPIDDALLRRWRAAGGADADADAAALLHLPAPNELLPTDFALLAPVQPELLLAACPEPPELVLSSPLCKMWHKLDRRFGQPKAFVELQLATAVTFESPRSSVMTTLAHRLISDALNESLGYPAELAGLKFDFSTTSVGLAVEVRGYHHRLPLLVRRLMEHIAAFSPAADRFALIKERLTRDFANFSLGQPHEMARYYVGQLTALPSWNVSEKLEALRDVELRDVALHLPRLLGAFSLEALCHGNVSRDTALAIARDVEAALRPRALLPSEYPLDRAVQLQPGREYHMNCRNANAADNNSAVYSYYQVGLDSTRSDVILDVLAQVIREPFFDSLRTKQQLGYMVFSGVRAAWGASGFRLVVQSATHTAHQLDERIEAFLLEMAATLDAMPDAVFARHIQSLIARKSEKDKRLTQETARIWSEISDHLYQFDRLAREIDVLRVLAKADVVDCFRRCLLDPATRAKLSVRFYSHKHDFAPELAAATTTTAAAAASPDGTAAAAATAPIVVIDPANYCLWRREMPLYPCHFGKYATPSKL